MCRILYNKNKIKYLLTTLCVVKLTEEHIEYTQDCQTVYGLPTHPYTFFYKSVL